MPDARRFQRFSRGMSLLPLLCLLGCLAPAMIDRAKALVQADDTCGPAALAIVFDHFHKPQKLETLISFLYRKELRGTLLPDMQSYARKSGFITYYEESSIENLRYYLKMKLPAILLVQRQGRGADAYHFLVITDFNPATAEFLYSDSHARDQIINERNLASVWEKTDNQLLLLYPGTVPNFSLPEYRSRFSMLFQEGAYFRACNLAREDLRPGNAADFYNLGSCELALRRFASACEHLEQSRQLGFDQAALYNNLAYCNLKRNQIEISLKYIKTALRMRPDDPEFLDTLALIGSRQSRDENTVPTILKKALAGARGQSAEIAFHLAVWYRLRNKMESTEYLELARRAATSERELFMIVAGYEQLEEFDF